MRDIYVYDACRTPRGRGKPEGSLHTITPVALAAGLLARLMARSELDPARLDDVVMGCVEPVKDQGADIARAAALMAGCDQRVPGVQVSRFCASGLEAVNIGAAKIAAGQADLVAAGGVEMMSRVPLFSGGGAWLEDPDVSWHTYFVPQGVSADLIATRHGYSREDVDSFAAESQRRCAYAVAEGYFEPSLEPVRDRNGLVVLDRDEHPRPNSTLDALAGLRPAFKKAGEEIGFDSVAIQRYPDVEHITHVHHAGNSSGIVDGASAVLLGAAETGEALGLTPRARIRGAASIGSEPTIMLTGPAPASELALARCGMAVADIDLFEVNEAFAAVVLRYMEDLRVAHDRVNVNGGAIALGHPVGATGGMLLGTLLDELERRDLTTGLVTLCVGAGMGTATIIERL